MADILTANDEMSKVREEMGFILYQWQHVEDSLFFIFSYLIGSKDRAAVSVTYHSIYSFSVRLGIINKLMRLRFRSKKRLAAWRRLHLRLKALEDVRNTVAHGVLLHSVGRPGRRTCLRPGLFDARLSTRPEKATDKMYLADLRRARQKIGLLAQALFVFLRGFPRHDSPRSRP